MNMGENIGLIVGHFMQQVATVQEMLASNNVYNRELRDTNALAFL